MATLSLDSAKVISEPAEYKRLEDVASEWDALANLRDEQMRSGFDVSFSRVLAPKFEEILGGEDCSMVFDVGCGTGALAERIASRVELLVGVDVSKESIRIAQSQTATTPKLTFIHDSIQSFADRQAANTFSCAIANMVLMDVLNLCEVVRAVRRVLRPGGGFIFSITHPVYWSVYKGYRQASWFEYKNEIPIEAPFTISKDDQGKITTTHVHRPLSAYQCALESNGFTIENFYAPLPDHKTEAKYPRPWSVPRFLIFQCRARSKAGGSLLVSG